MFELYLSLFDFVSFVRSWKCIPLEGTNSIELWCAHKRECNQECRRLGGIQWALRQMMGKWTRTCLLVFRDYSCSILSPPHDLKARKWRVSRRFMKLMLCPAQRTRNEKVSQTRSPFLKSRHRVATHLTNTSQLAPLQRHQQ